jgi:hypothetical protein
MIGRQACAAEERLMRKPVTIGFGLAFALSLLSGFGCALTNYELITDGDGNIVNTKGNAYIKQFMQTATAYPDGNDNLIWYVDQKGNGDRKLSTVNYFTTGTQNPFKDDLYCSPDWGGCRVVTANDPEFGDVDDYDYSVNTHCSGYRSLSLLVSTTRYYGECGKTRASNRSLKMLALANTMTPVQLNGSTWLRGSLNALNTSLVLDNRNGSTYTLPITSEIGITANFATRRMIVDLTNPNNRSLAENAIIWSNAHPGVGVEATLRVNGSDFVFHTKLMNNARNWPQLHY